MDTTAVEQIVQARLFACQDLSYRAFHCKLIPTVDEETIIGVRTPALRALAKEFAKTPEAAVFLQALPHRYYEENNLHGFLIERMTDYDETVAALDVFLPYVDNWGTCDLMSPKVFRRYLTELLTPIQRWMASDHPYTVRFGIKMLMTFYLDGEFHPDYLEMAADVRCEEYYVKMMVAWFFATALTKQYEATLPFFEQHRLPPWTHNKAIQKAVESNRIAAEQKTYLRCLKCKTAK